MELLGKRARKTGTENSSSSKHARNNSSVTRQTSSQHGSETKLLSSVALSVYDKAAQLALSPDQMTCFGCEVTKILVVRSCIVIIILRVDIGWFVQLMGFIKDLICGKLKSFHREDQMLMLG
jgi:hypothetical protein